MDHRPAGGTSDQKTESDQRAEVAEGRGSINPYACQSALPLPPFKVRFSRATRLALREYRRSNRNAGLTVVQQVAAWGMLAALLLILILCGGTLVTVFVHWLSIRMG